MGHFIIPRQQWFLVLVLDFFKKPHEMHKAIRGRVLLWVNQVVGMKCHIEPGFLTNDHCVWWVNIDGCNGIWKEKKGATYTIKALLKKATITATCLAAARKKETNFSVLRPAKAQKFICSADVTIWKSRA